MARRVKTDYHSKGFKHREHRSRKNRRRRTKAQREKEVEFKRKKLAILIKELDENTHNR